MAQYLNLAGVEALWGKIKGTFAKKSDLSSYLPLSGGTMTGKITMNTGTGFQMKYTSGGNEPWMYAYGYPSFGIRYFEGDPDKMTFSASGNNDNTSTADLCINGNGNGTVTIRGNTIWHAGNDGSGSGLDADKLDGIHVSGLFTNLSNSGNNISITIGGTNKTLTPAYATSATKLTTDAGSATNPIYFSGGKPVACTYSLNKTVPANAVFTDTTYNFSGVSHTSGNSNTGEHNCNSITSNGHWYYNSNGPATSLGATTNDGALYSQAYSSSWVAQIAQDYRNGNLFTRGKNNGTWTAWKAVSYSGHTHNKIQDVASGSDTTFAYSKSGLGYSDYTWLAGWNGYELRAVNKSQFATASHTHDDYLKKITVANNVENDFNNFSNMTLTGRGDPTTGASLKNAPWSGKGPAGGYGVLTYLWSGYGTQMAWGYQSNRIYIRNKYYANNTSTWSSSWAEIALTSDIPTNTNQLTNGAGFITNSTSYLQLNRANGARGGISFYSPSYNTWQTYMSNIVAGSGVKGNITPKAGSYVTTWAMRSVIENSSGYGWVWESMAEGGTSPNIMMELSSNTGNWKIAGNAYATGFYQSSDERLKTFHDPIKVDLEKLKTLRKNYFKFSDKDKLEIGVSAQEVQKIYPELVTSDEEGYLSIAYDKLSVIALKAIDELDNKYQKEINNLNDQLSTIKNILKEKGIL